MTTQRRYTVAVPCLALLACSLMLGGCGTIFESNESACRRILNHFEGCAVEAGASGGAGMFFGVPVSELCEDVPEDSSQNFPALADCLTSFSCAQLSGEEPVIDLRLQVRCLSAFSGQ